MHASRHFRFTAAAALLLIAGAGLWAETDPKITGALIEKLPRYSPPAPSPPAAPVSGESHERSDGTLVLPTLKVRPVTPRAPPAYAWLSPKGQLDLALKKYPGLQVGNLFGMNNGIALAMQVEGRRAQEKRELAEVVRASAPVASEESKRVQRLLEAALYRPSADWQKGREGK